MDTSFLQHKNSASWSQDNLSNPSAVPKPEPYPLPYPVPPNRLWGSPGPPHFSHGPPPTGFQRPPRHRELNSDWRRRGMPSRGGGGFRPGRPCSALPPPPPSRPGWHRIGNPSEQSDVPGLNSSGVGTPIGSGASDVQFPYPRASQICEFDDGLSSTDERRHGVSLRDCAPPEGVSLEHRGSGVREFPPALQVTIQKTRLCVHLTRGRPCPKRDCMFAHSTTELRQRPDLFRTKLCRMYNDTGLCDGGNDCRFAHGMQELRHVRSSDFIIFSNLLTPCPD